MTRKLTTAKLKAHLAMVAFLAVTIIAITLTSFGALSYATLTTNVPGDSERADVQSAPFGVAAWSSIVAALTGK